LLRWLHSCHRSAKWISWFYQTILASVFTNFITCYDQFHEIYDFYFWEKIHHVYFSFKIECTILEPSASFIRLYLWATMRHCYSTLECKRVSFVQDESSKINVVHIYTEISLKNSWNRWS
jgi:hypothetical protein